MREMDVFEFGKDIDVEMWRCEDVEMWEFEYWLEMRVGVYLYVNQYFVFNFHISTLSHLHIT